MSYREENGQVILEMSREDYAMLSKVVGWLTFQSEPEHQEVFLDEVAALLNRLNSGNPNYTPYQVEAEKK